MKAEVEIKTERVDDIPLLMWQQKAMGIPGIIDEVITPHGNRQGLSIGWTVAGWLTYILSESDHRLSYVEPWVETHLSTLSRLMPMGVQVQDFTDDRLGDVLRYLSDDEKWDAIECKIGQHLVNVYELPTQSVRLDSTSVVVYHDADGESLFAAGHSKDHRPDLAQFKVMLSALDPMALPLATQVIRGNEADDGLYIPAIDQSRKVLKRQGLLYIGDSKMEALATRAHLVNGEDFYLIPLSHKGRQAALLAELLGSPATSAVPLTEVRSNRTADRASRLVAQAYETVRRQEAIVNDTCLAWEERLLVVHSPVLAEQAERGLTQRLQRAQAKLRALTPAPGRGKKQWTEVEPLAQAVTQILQHYHVADLLQIAYPFQVTKRQIRRHLDRPARTEEIHRYSLTVTLNDAALAAVRRTFGWRLFVTNCSQVELPLSTAILTYRQAPVAERDFSRLKGVPLGLRPVYLHRDDHLIGLVRLLSLALRLLTLVESLVRQRLLEAQATLPGLYPGNPKQQTQQPTTERLLQAFQNLTLTFIYADGQSLIHLSPLSTLQLHILALIGFPVSIYTDLTCSLDPIPI